MKLNHRDILLCFVLMGICIIYYSCASSGSPRGGRKDETPPKLDSLKSTQNEQTNYRSKLITFYFDEFIEVKDALKQVLVSPPLVFVPKVKHRGKKVTFAFDDQEVLKENVTYTINFGEAVVDFHEGNKLNNFTFVFSTGPVIDSLSLSGKIVNSLTNQPDGELVVFLYENNYDSIVRKEKPYYFSKPDKNGLFEFRNIKSDTFKIFAVKDANLNYLYDLESEKIAFLDSSIVLTDSFKTNLTLFSSTPTPKLKLTSKDAKHYGKINLLFNANIKDSVLYRLSDSTISHAAEFFTDSINIYYDTRLDSFRVFVYNDTIDVKPKRKDDFLKKTPFKKDFQSFTNVILPKDSIVIGYNLPIVKLRNERIQITDSIGSLDNIVITQSTDLKKIILKYPWEAGEKYQLTLDSTCFESIYGHYNDSLSLSFTVLQPIKTAALTINITDMDSTKHYIIKILKEKQVVFTFDASMTSNKKIPLKGLIPDKYDVEIVEDLNQNGQWDPGHYWKKKQPEKYQLFKGDKLRENWEVAMDIFWTKGRATPNEPNQAPGGLKGANNLKPPK